MLSLFQVTEDRDEKREEDRERQKTAFPLLLLRTDHCYFLSPFSVLPFLLHFPTPSFPLSPPLTPALLSPHSKFASTSLSQSLQIMTFGECTLYTKNIYLKVIIGTLPVTMNNLGAVLHKQKPLSPCHLLYINMSQN